MIKRNIVQGFVFAVVCLLQVITIAKINRVQNTIDVDKTSIDEISYVPVNKEELSRTDETYSPITIREDNPETPYDDYVNSDQVKSNYFKGAAYNPEGPAGVEGQIPPVYSDMSNVIGNRIKERESE